MAQTLDVQRIIIMYLSPYQLFTFFEVEKLDRKMKFAYNLCHKTVCMAVAQSIHSPNFVKYMPNDAYIAYKIWAYFPSIVMVRISISCLLFDKIGPNLMLLQGLELHGCLQRQLCELSSIVRLRSLTLWGAQNIRDIGALSVFGELRYLAIYDCQVVRNIDFVINCKKLKSLRISTSFESLHDVLQNLNGLVGHKCIKHLYFSVYNELENLDALIGCDNLRTVNLRVCKRLKNIDGLLKCKLVRQIILSQCSNLTTVDPTLNCPKLEHIDLSWGWDLMNVDFLGNCCNLRCVSLYNCIALTNCDVLIRCDNLRELNVAECSNLDMDLLNRCKQLNELLVNGSHMEKIRDLGKCCTIKRYSRF